MPLQGWIIPALLVSHFQASIWALNRGKDNAYKPDGKTARTFDKSLQWHQILLSCSSLTSSASIPSITACPLRIQFSQLVTIRERGASRPKSWAEKSASAPSSSYGLFVGNFRWNICLISLRGHVFLPRLRCLWAVPLRRLCRADGPHRDQHPRQLQVGRPPEGQGRRERRGHEDLARAAPHYNGTA